MQQSIYACAHAFLLVSPGLIGPLVNTGKSGQYPAVRETGDIANLSHKLWAKRGADTIRRHDDRIFRKHGGSLVHIEAELPVHGF